MSRYSRHGYGKHPLAKILRNMLTRCNNPNRHNSKYYFGSGIKVCTEWLSTKAFVEWGIANGWKPGLVIDRKDPDKGYCPQNCQFISALENTKRRKFYRKLYFAFDRAEDIYIWSAMSGIKWQTLWARINRYHMSMEEALLR